MRSLFFLVLAGCSSVAVTSSEGDIVTSPSAVCATIDYAHATPSSAYYRHFESDTKAAEYIEKIIGSGMLASHSGPKAKLREISNDPRLVKLVREVYDGFKTVFPKETTGLPDAPRIAIVESDVVNAFALGPGFDGDQSPWLFIVHTALLEKNASDTELRGLFAHELGHLILRTFLPEIQRQIRAVYKVEGSERGILGAAQDDDPALADHVEKILAIHSRIGGVPTLGLPLTIDTALYAKMTTALVDHTPGCEVAKEKMDELKAAQRALIPGAPSGNFVPRVPTAAERETLDRLSTELASELETCLASHVGTFAELVAMANRLSPDDQEVQDLMLPVEKNLDATLPSAPIIDKILRAAAELGPELIALHEDPTVAIDQVRVFDYEEDADDAAVRVLSAMGDDPIGNGKFLLGLLPTEETKRACEKAVSAGDPIPYGRLIDVHPPICWRYFHAIEFAKAMKTCRPAPAKPRSIGRPSIAERLAPATFERGHGVSPLGAPRGRD